VRVKVVRERLGWAPLLEVLRSRNAWGMAFGYASWNYFWYLLVNWGPTYLFTARGVPIKDLGWVAGLLYLVVGASELTGGWIVGRLLRRGWSTIRAFRFVIALGFGLGVLALPASIVTGQWLAVGLLYLSATSGMLIAGIMVVPTQVAPKSHVGTWMSFQNFVANVPGIVGPVVTGWLVKRTGSFVSAFGLAALICLGGIGCYFWWLKTGEHEPSVEAAVV
jgi:ACS family D-galactonate transporter-like MFS transporter